MEDVILGTVIALVPVFATFDAKTVGYVSPPSVDNKISTLAQLTAPVAVPASFQVTVSEVNPVHVIPAALGKVSTKGPELASTVTVTSCISEQLTSGRGPALSLTVTLKFIVLETVGNTSHVNGPPAIKSVRFGK